MLEWINDPANYFAVAAVLGLPAMLIGARIGWTDDLDGGRGFAILCTFLGAAAAAMWVPILALAAVAVVVGLPIAGVVWLTKPRGPSFSEPFSIGDYQSLVEPRGGCRHNDTVEVDNNAFGVVAHLCRGCGQQLPPDWPEQRAAQAPSKPKPGPTYYCHCRSYGPPVEMTDTSGEIRCPRCNAAPAKSKKIDIDPHWWPETMLEHVQVCPTQPNPGRQGAPMSGMTFYPKVFTENDTRVEKVVARRAALTVCETLGDVGEAREIIEMLGLLPHLGVSAGADDGIWDDTDELVFDQSSPEPEVASCRRCDIPLVVFQKGRPAPRGTSYHRARGLCNRCYRNAQRASVVDRYPTLEQVIGSSKLSASQQARFVEQVLDLEDCSPESVASHFGVTVATVARRLYRLGRPDLGRRFDRADKKLRRQKGR